MCRLHRPELVKEHHKGWFILPILQQDWKWNWGRAWVFAFYTQWPHNLCCEQIRNPKGDFQGLSRRSILPDGWKWDSASFLFFCYSRVLKWWFSCCFHGLTNWSKWRHRVNTRAIFYQAIESPSLLYSISVCLAGLSSQAPQRRLDNNLQQLHSR